ncbi:uncharacterized protein C1orf167 homolog [Dama dama]|uniref:uncharacterized protein C1orf167 homolog n=1 Tax=Dama dama TaxID=30532 RepID=UPI002A3718F7|nr:uncharacterized protein C1orf167 homolog [Dama dama]
MELRPDASHKENVPPRPATSLRPEPRRLRKSLGVGLASRRGWWVPVGPAERGGPAATPCPGTALRQEPCRVQSNLASPNPSLGLVLRDMTGRLTNSSFQQQDNLQPLVGRPQGRVQDFAIQQSNLCARETHTAECGRLTSPQLWSEPQESFRPHLMPQGSPLPRGPLAHPSSNLRQSWLLATDISCPDIRLATGLAPLKGPTWSDPRSRCGLGGWTSRLVGEPLTLKDLAVPAQSPPRAPSQAAIHQLLVCVQRLECQAVRLRCQVSREFPGPVRQEPWTRAGQTLPVRPQLSQPVLDSWDERRRHSRGLRETTSFPETPGPQEVLSDSQASSKHASLGTTLEMLPGDALDPEQVVLSACPLRQGEQGSPGTTHGWGQRGDPLRPPGVDSREARLCSSASSSSAQGILPGREGGDGTPRERISREKERPASRNALQSKARNTVNLEPELGRWQWLSRCFRAWWRWAQRRRAVAAAVALGRRQLLRRGLRALRWALWLREAQLEAAWGRHTQALLARTFQKWRHLIQQHKQGQPHFHAGPRPLCSGGDQDQGPSGRKPVVDGAWRSRGWGGPPPPNTWHSPAAGAAWVALLDPQHQRACLCRCFGAWQRFVQRGTRYRAHVANLQAGTLRTCLQQWVQMKQLRASDGAKVAQLSLCWRKAGNMALFSSVPEGATVHGLRLMATARVLPQEQGWGSLQEACRRLALQRALLLWRTRLSQHQQADSFFEGMQWRALRHILRGWRLRARDAGSARIASAPDPLGGALGGEAPPGHSTHRRSSWDKASRAPALLEMLQLSLLCAVGRRQQGQCLLLWRARAQQSRDAARWQQSKLQRRILLDWSHWATAQGARRGLAARWAWNRRCRATLGLWRQRLVQRREVEWRAREWGRRLQQRALGHWHCYWQRQVFLQEKCQRWVQARLQGLRSAVFWGWQQAAARRRPVAASPEQLLLQRGPGPTPPGSHTIPGSLPSAARAAPLPLFCRHFQAWCGAMKASRAERSAFQDGLRRRIPRATFASEAQVPTAQPRELRVARASCWRSREQGCQADRQLRRTWAQQAFVARRVALGQCCKAHQQTGETSRAQALCWMLWARESCQHRVLRDRAVPTVSARWVPSSLRSVPYCVGPAWTLNLFRVRVQSIWWLVAGLWGLGVMGENILVIAASPGVKRQLCILQPRHPLLGVLKTWTQSATQGHVQRTAITHFQQAGPRRFLRTHWAQWRTALLRVWLEPQAQEASRAHPARRRASLQRWPGLATRGRLLVLMNPPALKRQTRSCRPSAMGPSPTQHRSPSGQMRGEVSWAQSPAAPAAELPAGQAPGSHVAALGRCSWGREAGMDTREWGAPSQPHADRPPRPFPSPNPWTHGLSKAAGGERQRRGWGLPGTAVGSARGLLVTVPTAQAVASEMGLATVAGARPAVAGGSAVTAFNKWHQCLAARGLRAKASSSMRPWSKAGLRRPGSRPEAARAPALGGPGAEKGAQLQL